MTLWAIARQAPLSVGFSRQECWSELPFLPPGDPPKPRVKQGLVVCFKKACFDNPTSYVDGQVGLFPGIQVGGGRGCMQKEKGERALKQENKYEESSIRGRGGGEVTRIVGKSMI